jgi:hypothetical protein
MPRLNAYWLTAAGLWMLAIGLTCWNLSTIEAVSMARDNGERLRNEVLFQRQYIGKLEAVRQTAETYALPVDSVQLGFLTVQQQLEALAAVFGLQKVKVARLVGQTDPEQWPLTVSFEGAFQGTAGFLQALRQYPYLNPQRLQVKIAEDSLRASTEIQLVFQFRLKPAESAPPPPVRTTRYPIPSEERPS